MFDVLVVLAVAAAVGAAAVVVVVAVVIVVVVVVAVVAVVIILCWCCWFLSLYVVSSLSGSGRSCVLLSVLLIACLLMCWSMRPAGSI